VELKEIIEESASEVAAEQNEAAPPATDPEPAPTPVPVPEAVAQEQPAMSAQQQQSDAIPALLEMLKVSKVVPHWPMYLRTFKQFLRSLQPPFDERTYGLSSAYDLARMAHREGLLRVERNRQGILRIYPGDRFPRTGRIEEQAVLEQPVQEAAAFAEPETVGLYPEAMIPELQEQLAEPTAVQQEQLFPIEEQATEITSQAEPEQPASESEPAPTEIQMEAVEISAEPEQKPKSRRSRKPFTGKAAKTGKSEVRKPRSKKEK
jgi:hypothetical protein